MSYSTSKGDGEPKSPPLSPILTEIFMSNFGKNSTTKNKLPDMFMIFILCLNGN